MLGWIKRKSAEIQGRYQINPWIFIFLYLATWPPYIYGWVKVMVSLTKKDSVGFMMWLGFVLINILIPYTYIAIWGKNLPRKFYYILGLIAVLAVVSALRKLYF